MPIDRRHFIGHADVPAPGGGRGGSSHHTDPGPRWKWDYYLRLVRRYAGAQKLSVLPRRARGAAARHRPVAREGDRRHRPRRVLDQRPRRRESTGARRSRSPGGLNTTKLGNGTHVLQVHGVAGPGRYDIARKTIVVDNKAFALTSAGARPWTKVRGPVKLRVRPWGAKAAHR